MRRDGDCFHYAVDWRDPGAPAWQGWTGGLAEPHGVRLSDPETLMIVVRLSVDPYAGAGATVVRSIATCRAVTFGWDGQAYLCLRHEDDPPVSPNPTLVVVEERPELISETDYFDGWLRQSAEPSDAD